MSPEPGARERDDWRARLGADELLSCSHVNCPGIEIGDELPDVYPEDEGLFHCSYIHCPGVQIGPRP